MPNWLIPTLKWGGILVAVVFVIALVVAGQAEAPAEGSEEATSAAPITLYWVLLVIGVVAAVVGFVLGRRQKT